LWHFRAGIAWQKIARSFRRHFQFAIYFGDEGDFHLPIVSLKRGIFSLWLLIREPLKTMISRQEQARNAGCDGHYAEFTLVNEHFQWSPTFTLSFYRSEEIRSF